MAGLGDTLRTWIDARAAEWKGRLAGWLIDSTVNATEAVAAQVEPQILELVQDQLDTLRNMEGLPLEIKSMLDKLVVPSNPAVLAGLVAFLIAFTANLANGVSKQALEPVMQQLAKLTPFHVPGLSEILDLKLRRGMTDAEYVDLVGRTGWSKAWADRFLDLKHPTLPSEIALSASLRDPVKYKWAVDNLPRLGLTPADIDLLTEMQWRVPGVQDIIRYVVKEAYDEATYKAFGQDQEYPGMAEADAAKAGVRPDQLMKEWISHWELPGISQGYEMMHRHAIEPDMLAKLMKARDVMPFWRTPLEKISWSLPGRIETRMMALYGLIDKAGVVDLLAKDGLAAEYRDVVADMNIVRGVKSDLQVRYTNGWITTQELYAEIVAHNLTPAIADQLYMSIVKNSQAARTVTQKNLTLAQIEKGVKKGKLTRAEAITLITDIGYDLQEATYLLAVDCPEDEDDAAKKKRDVTKADILSGLEHGVLIPSQARERLIALRYTPADADYILQVYQASIKPAKPEAQKEATRSDVENSVKLGLISPEDGYNLLLAMKYTPDAASFILTINAAEQAAKLVTRSLELSRSDILAALKSNIIGDTEVLTRLEALGYGTADALTVLTIFKASLKPEATVAAKEATRADIEKAVRLGLITRDQGYSMLIDMGYTPDAAQFVLDINVQAETAAAADRRIALDKADVFSQIRAGTLTDEAALNALTGLGYDDQSAALIVNLYRDVIAAPEAAPLVDITKADIVAAVKRGLITPEDGYKLLIRLGIDSAGATFILSVAAESSPFSPLNYDEFKALTGSWRRSQGLTDEVLPPAAQELRLAQAQAVAEGRQPVLETLRIQIDTIRRQRRSGAITREVEIAALTKLQVPPDYLAAIVANDDARIAARK